MTEREKNGDNYVGTEMEEKWDGGGGGELGGENTRERGDGQLHGRVVCLG